MRGLRANCFACCLRAKGKRKKRVAESDSGPNLLRHPAATVAKLQIRETADVEALSLEKLLHLDHPL